MRNILNFYIMSTLQVQYEIIKKRFLMKFKDTQETL